MLRYGGLRQWETLNQIAADAFSPLREHAQDPDTYGMSQGLGQKSQVAIGVDPSLHRKNTILRRCSSVKPAAGKFRGDFSVETR
jgi:hypothetical protein